MWLAWNSFLRKPVPVWAKGHSDWKTLLCHVLYLTHMADLVCLCHQRETKQTLYAHKGWRPCLCFFWMLQDQVPRQCWIVFTEVPFPYSGWCSYSRFNVQDGTTALSESSTESSRAACTGQYLWRFFGLPSLSDIEDIVCGPFWRAPVKFPALLITKACDCWVLIMKNTQLLPDVTVLENMCFYLFVPLWMNE